MRRLGPMAPALLLAAASCSIGAGPARPAVPVCHGAPGPSARVFGSQLLDGGCRPLRLLGVNRSGTEFQCVQAPPAVFSGPVDESAIAAMAAWNVNAVRVPLNEDCWLGINGVDPRASGPPYQQAVRGYVARLNQAGLVAVLDLHWNAPGADLAAGQQAMADAEHAPLLWRSVAGAYRDVPGVIFDLYNEPRLDSLPDERAWRCWRLGCAYGGWATAGMQALVAEVRKAGAAQPVVVAGLRSGSDLSGWLTHRPDDPGARGLGSQLVAGVHLYWQLADERHCRADDAGAGPCALSAQRSFWEATVAPVARNVPVLTAELGEFDCRHTYVDAYMDWADAHGVSYLGWAWNTEACGDFPSLVTDYAGTATPYGAGLCAHLAALAGSARPRACIV